MTQLLVTVLLLVSPLSSGTVNVAQIGSLVAQMVEKGFVTCHLVFMTTDSHSPVFSAIQRAMEVGMVVVEVDDNIKDNNRLHTQLWGTSSRSCRVVILHITQSSTVIGYRNLTVNSKNRTIINDNLKQNMMVALSVLELAGLRKFPETMLIGIGELSGMEAVLLHHALRNTVVGLYMTIQHPESEYVTHMSSFLPSMLRFPESLLEDRVSLYRRCHLCLGEKKSVHFIHRLNLSTLIDLRTDPYVAHLFSKEQFTDLKGQTLSVVSVPHFPYVDYERSKEGKGGVMTLKDTMDARLLQTFSEKINFTYITREEPNLAFGLDKDGIFSGMVGQLQREEVDFTTVIGPSPPRLKVVDFVQSYPSDKMTLVSLQPSFLPKHLTFIKPFTDIVWLCTLCGIIFWGITYWMLHTLKILRVQGRKVELSKSMLYSVGAIVEQSCPDPSNTTVGQILVGWWLVFALVICTGFRSSLIAHLTVQSTTKPVETMEDMVAAENWRWAIEPWLMKGIPIEYFANHPQPLVKTIYKRMEVFDAIEGLKKVQKGRFSLFDLENYIKMIILSNYTDIRGRTPFHVSKKGFTIMATSGWSFRKGAPFFERFGKLFRRLEDAGVIVQWREEVMARRARENRKKIKPYVMPFDGINSESEIVLGLEHLQSAFYLLLFGFGIGFIFFVLETIGLKH